MAIRGVDIGVVGTPALAASCITDRGDRLTFGVLKVPAGAET